MSAQITVHVADTQRSVAQGTTAGELFEGDRSVLVARVDGELRDLAHVLVGGEHVEPVTAAEQDGLDVLRHSAAHVLAQAVQQVQPRRAKLGIGPPIRDGFYYDFDVATPFTPEDLKALEKVMQRSSTRARPSTAARSPTRTPSSSSPASPTSASSSGLKGGASEEAAEGAAVEVGGAQLTIYDNVRRDGSRAWGDLCRGPHVPSTKVLGNAFKLMRSAAAYWRGSEKNPQLQRSTARPGRPRPTWWPTSTGSPRPRSATTASSGPSSTCSLPRRDRLRAAGLPPQGRHHQARDGGLRPPSAHRGGVRVRRHPAHRQGGAVPHLRHLPYYADTMFPPSTSTPARTASRR
jgi:threonyl-tRNA synthetase